MHCTLVKIRCKVSRLAPWFDAELQIVTSVADVRRCLRDAIEDPNPTLIVILLQQL